MDKKHSEASDKPSPPLYPPPDFSLPPPARQETRKTFPKTSSREKFDLNTRDTKRRDRHTSRDRERHRNPYSSSSRDSRDHRSQSRHSTSSRYSSRDHDSRRHDDRSRGSSKRQRSRSRSRTSSRRSPSHRSTSSRKSPQANHERSSRSHRSSPKRATRTHHETPRNQRRSSKDQTERERLLVKWRKNYCETSDQISKKLQELANDEDQASWIRASPADIHYRRSTNNTIESTPRLDTLCNLFEEELTKRADRARATQDPYNAPLRRRKVRVCRHKCKFHILIHFCC